MSNANEYLWQLTLEDVKKSVKDIRGLADDDEAAHVEEDRLYLKVLIAIAEGRLGSDAASICKEALKTRKIKFTRYCA